MIKHWNAGWFWLLDLVGASWFAWGIAEAVSRAAAGLSEHYYAYAAIIGGGLMRAVSVFAVQHFAIATAQRSGVTLRASLFDRLLGRPMATPVSMGGSAVLAIDHVRTIEEYDARFMPARVGATLAPLVVIAVVACASLVAAGILMLTLIPFIVGMIMAGTAARRASQRQLAALGELSGLFVDRVRTLPIIRHFGAEDRIARQVQGATREVADRTVTVLRAAFLSSAVLEFFSALAVALVAVYCGFSLLDMLPFPDPEQLTLREAFFALAMAPEFYLPMRRLAAAYHEKQLGEAAREELAALPEPMATPPAAPWSGVQAEGLAIAWPGHSIGPLDFAIRRTGMIALTGPTGSGKTSVLSAIAGQVAPASGRVTPVDPGDIAWTAQQPLILPGTLRDNLILACPEASPEAVADAVRAVGLDTLVGERGLDLPLDHRGSGLSGGERRRVGLARAILSERPLLLCDEPTADLDAEAAEAVVALLTELARSRALIVATHDARLIAAADAEVTL